MSINRFLDYVLRHLICFPEDLAIFRDEQHKRVVYRLRMRQIDIGKIVGKHGQTIASIRNLIGSAAARDGGKVLVEIIEDTIC